MKSSFQPRNIFLLLFLIAWANLVQAQQLYLIPKAGVSIHNFQPAGDFNYQWYLMDNQSGTGLSGGIALEIGLSKNNRWAFQPEILWVPKGCKLVYLDPHDMINYYNEIYKINYLEIPLLVKTTFSISRLQFFINAGPSIGIGIGGKRIYLDNPYWGAQGGFVKIRFSDRSGSSDTQITPRVDWSLQAGGGISYTLGTVKLLVEGRYGLGLNTISAIDNGSARFLPSHHRFLLLNVGLAIPLQKK